MIGIYKITNIINNKIYIGSSKEIDRRWYLHKYLLNKNEHYNKHLQYSWNKYGEDNFKFDIVEILNDEIKIFEREQAWIDKERACDKNIGYNINKLATGGGLYGVDNGMFGKGYLREGENNTFYGKRHSEESKLKMSNATIGMYIGEKSHSTNLSNEAVLEIKEKLTKMEIPKDLAIEYKTTERIIYHIKCLETWEYIGSQFNNKLKEMMRQLISREQGQKNEKDIISQYLNKLSNQEISNLLDLPKGTVSKAIIKFKNETNIIIKSKKLEDKEKLEEQVCILYFKDNLKNSVIRKLLKITENKLDGLIQKYKKLGYGKTI